MAARTLSVITTGFLKCAPPWTTRCPTASISKVEAMARAFPSRAVRSRCRITCSRERTGNSSLKDDTLRVFHKNRRGVATPLDFPLPQGDGRMIRDSLANFV